MGIVIWDLTDINVRPVWNINKYIFCPQFHKGKKMAYINRPVFYMAFCMPIYFAYEKKLKRTVWRYTEGTNIASCTFFVKNRFWKEKSIFNVNTSKLFCPDTSLHSTGNWKNMYHQTIRSSVKFVLQYQWSSVKYHHRERITSFFAGNAFSTGFKRTKNMH